VGQAARNQGNQPRNGVARKALITGGSGQDAHYLAHFLATKGYELHIQSRRPPRDPVVVPAAAWHTVSLADEDAIERLLRSIRPHEIYNLASFSRPEESWNKPMEVASINAVLPHRVLEVIRNELPETRFFQASSSEIFGDSPAETQNENTPLQPQTPYAVAKAYAHSAVRAYRSRHRVYACSGILFNHESPRRPLTYVTQKIATAAALVSLRMADSGERDEFGRPILIDGHLSLGNLDVRRDFGFAGDHVRAMWLMLQQEQPDDYVIGTGDTQSIIDICAIAFSHVGRDWRSHVVVDPRLVRAVDSHYTRADVAKARTILGWQPVISFEELMRMMVDARIEALLARQRASVSSG
jgi:GDPmannose 4,6-dehydratase